MVQFSLLMCVYEKDSPEALTQCLDSILSQTVMPDELIIVKDGPLTEALDAVLDALRFPNELNIIALPENVTLGPARAEGVKAAKYEWIAIMDSDDICLPDRFEKQINMTNSNSELGLVGGQIAEFTDDPDNTVTTRTVPTSHKDIIKFARKRNPFNHMAVMFKRETVIKAGHYRYFPWFEDYDLWARMITNGVKCANHPDILVHARIGDGMYKRRRGLAYIKSEWRMQKQLKELGFIGGLGLIYNAAMRLPVRMLPEKGIEALYSKVVR